MSAPAAAPLPVAPPPAPGAPPDVRPRWVAGDLVVPSDVADRYRYWDDRLPAGARLTLCQILVELDGPKGAHLTYCGGACRVYPSTIGRPK